jgi:hypothetical protein
MGKRFLCLVAGLAALIASPALAQQGTFTSPTWTQDINGASFGTVVGPLVAGTDYSLKANNGSPNAINQLFRAVNVTCSSSASANLTMVGSATALPYTFASGPSYQIAFVLKSIDAIPSGCVLYGLK